MNRWLKAVCVLAIFFDIPGFTSRAAADLDTSSHYFGIYFEIQKADELEKNGAYLESLFRFKWCTVCLDKLEQDRPGWEEKVVAERIKHCDDEAAKLMPLATAQILQSQRATLQSGPPVSGLFDAGVDFENHQDDCEALIRFEEFKMSLEIMHESDPKWESDTIQKKLLETQAKIEHLQGPALRQSGL